MADEPIPPTGAGVPGAPPSDAITAGSPGGFALGMPPGATPPVTASTSGSGASKQKSPANPPPPPHDSFRELLETIVFVVVLVLILKTFLAEAFVIPTGSMATTLLGYHREETCQQCGYRWWVNSSKESDPDDASLPEYVVEATCPNCRYHNRLGRRGP